MQWHLSWALKDQNWSGPQPVQVAVSEPAAVLAARQASDIVDIIIPKVKRGNVTLAIAKAKYTL